METWILVVFLASNATNAGVAGVQVGLFASAAQCKSASKVVADSARYTAGGKANTVCVQTTHRSYSK